MTAPPLLQRFVEQAAGDVLVLHDGPGAPVAAGLEAPDLVRHPVEHAPEPPGLRWAAVVLIVADAGSLRRAASVLASLGRTRSTALLLLEGDRPAALLPRPEWPPAQQLQARRTPTGSMLTTARWARPAPANGVFEELARTVVPARTTGTHDTWVALTDPTGPVPPADPETLLSPGAVETDLTLPPDVVVGALPVPPDLQPVVDRAPVVVSPAGDLGPLDEGVLNPRGFVQGVQHGVVELVRTSGTDLEAQADGVVTRFDLARGATALNVAELRPYQGLHLRWDERDDPATARLVAGLAMAGVPMLSDAPPAAAAALLGAPLSHALVQPADLADPLRREEHSVSLRRAALDRHSDRAWRARLREQAGLPPSPAPTVSVLLATRRPHQLPFALRQVARQRGVDFELVLAAHGFEADPALVREHLGERAVVLAVPQDVLFGDVLNAAATAASGDLLVKMDDDDWYGPEFLADLVRARRYSGADLVGMTAEYVYLEALGRTLRRTDDSEREARFVAGGTMLLDRSYLAHLGGFRSVRRYVDAQLLSAVRSCGGSVYRTHGLGYVIRRSEGGHTWDPGVEFYLDEQRIAQQWEGFVPSRMLEVSGQDTPR